MRRGRETIDGTGRPAGIGSPAEAALRCTEGRSGPVTHRIEPGFKRCNLGELLGRKLAAQRFDRLQECLGAVSAGDGIVSQAPGARSYGLPKACLDQAPRRPPGAKVAPAPRAVRP